MFAFRSLRFRQCQARLVTCLIIVGWLAFAQPGTSYYWLLDPGVHARIDAELYGQQPDGETLPGHAHHLPHEHPRSLGNSVSDLALANRFDAAFYRALLSPAQRLALLDRHIEMVVTAHSITLEPPDQPPRPVA